MEDHANLAMPAIESLAKHLEGDSMRNAIAALPVFEELSKLTITRTTMRKMHKTLKIMKTYKDHDDPIVKLKAKKIVGAWQLIYGLGAESNHFCANDVLSS